MCLLQNTSSIIFNVSVLKLRSRYKIWNWQTATDALMFGVLPAREGENEKFIEAIKRFTFSVWLRREIWFKMFSEAESTCFEDWYDVCNLWRHWNSWSASASWWFLFKSISQFRTNYCLESDKRVMGTIFFCPLPSDSAYCIDLHNYLYVSRYVDPLHLVQRISREHYALEA